MLSRGRRLTLIKSTLARIPIYMMSLYNSIQCGKRTGENLMQLSLGRLCREKKISLSGLEQGETTIAEEWLAFEIFGRF